MNKARRSRGPWFWPVVMTAVGVVLLLHNFLLLGDFNVVDLWPLLLVAIGAQILLRGDLLPSGDSGTFGITRGSVESATLEISSGEVDVELRALQREGRLIAGQFASQSRPQLSAVETHAHLRMYRANTPWFSLADWQIGMARGLPWQILVSTHLGQVKLDLSELIVSGVTVGTGLGDVRVVAPFEALEPLHLRSAMGNIHIVTPPGHRVQINVTASRLFHVHADEKRYECNGSTFVAREAREDAPPVEIYVSGTFGDAYLT